MRQKRLSARVHRIENRLVVRVCPRRVRILDRQVAEADGGEGDRRQPLPARFRVDLRGQPPRFAHVPGNDLRQALPPICANDHPQLEGAEAAAQRQAVIHQVDHVLLVRLEVFGDQRECAFQIIRPPRVQQAAIDRRQQPFVRIGDERIGTVAARQHVSVRRHQRRGTAVRRVHVQPHPVAFAYVGNRRHRVDAGRGRGAHGRDDRQRRHPRVQVGADRFVQQVGAQTEVAIDRDMSRPAPADAQRYRGLVDRTVRVGRGVHGQRAQVGASRQPLFADVEAERLARRGQRVQRRSGGRVGDLAEPVRRQPEQVGDPAEGPLF